LSVTDPSAKQEKAAERAAFFLGPSLSSLVRACKPESIIARCSKIDQVHLGKGMPYFAIPTLLLIDRTLEA
jgi:hypothetical protein